MSKLARVTQRLFASNPGSQQVEQFGSFANGGANYSVDPTVIQSLGTWLTGWFGAIVGDDNPCIEDMNAICLVYAYQLAQGFQDGIPQWDAGTTYYKGSYVQDTSGTGFVYVSITDSNLNNDVSTTANWSLAIGGGSSASVRTVTTNTTIQTTDGTVRSDSTSGNLTMTLPPLASVPVGKRITIKDVGTGSHTTTIIGNSTEVIDGANTYGTALAQYDSITVQSNRTNWDVV